MPSATKAQTSQDRRLIWILGIALVVVLVTLVISLVRPADSSSDSAATTPGADGASEALPDLSRRIDGDVTAIGEVDAPVVLIEFADYRCPFCAIFARESLPTLVKDYVDQGNLRIEWRDVPVFGEESVAAAIAARAAGQQDLYWEYNKAIFAYNKRDHQALPRERLIEIATEVGVPDMAAFEAALDDPELAEQVSQDAAEAESLGIRSTPTFVIGQTPIMGAQPVGVFTAAIDEELARMGQ